MRLFIDTGCDVATVPAKVLRQMLSHPLTMAGIERFEADWAARPEFAEWLAALVDGSPAASADSPAATVGAPAPAPAPAAAAATAR
jgi:hypothetical protein